MNASTGTNYNYEWYKDGQLINGVTASSYQATSSGNYTVKVIDGVCNTTSTPTAVSVLNCANLKEIENNKIEIFPNPTKDILFIKNEDFNLNEGYTIKILTITGTIVYNQVITSEQIQISLNKIGEKGIYFAQILNRNNEVVQKKKIVLE